MLDDPKQTSFSVLNSSEFRVGQDKGWEKIVLKLHDRPMVQVQVQVHLVLDVEIEECSNVTSKLVVRRKCAKANFFFF